MKLKKKNFKLGAHYKKSKHSPTYCALTLADYIEKHCDGINQFGCTKNTFVLIRMDTKAIVIFATQTAGMIYFLNSDEE